MSGHLFKAEQSRQITNRDRQRQPTPRAAQGRANGAGAAATLVLALGTLNSLQETRAACIDFCGAQSFEVRLLDRGIATSHGQMPQRLWRLMTDLIDRRICPVTLATATPDLHALAEAAPALRELGGAADDIRALTEAVPALQQLGGAAGNGAGSNLPRPAASMADWRSSCSGRISITTFSCAGFASRWSIGKGTA